MTHSSGPGAGEEATDAPSRGAFEDRRLIRAELCRLIEPGDLLAGVALEVLGAEPLHALITAAHAPSPDQRHQLAQAAESAGLGPRQQDLRVGLARWRTRCGQLHGARDLATMDRLGGGLLIPEDPAWPAQLSDLGPLAPVALWFRAVGSDSVTQALQRLPPVTRAVSIVGSREVTDYGLRVTAELTQELVRGGLCVISGGAYGVDAAAHRAALREARARDSAQPSASEPRAREDPAAVQTAGLAPTIAVLAGGLDRFYPAGNEALLRDVGARGLLLSEMAPGSAPTRHRFLQRNRLIAALSMVTVITEARWRSGAQSTAHHALGLGREVGVVPGSVYSASSAGCHRLLKETPAQLVRDATDILRLVSGHSAPSLDRSAERRSEPRDSVAATGSDAASPRQSVQSVQSVQPELPGTSRLEHPQDGLTESQRLLLDALPRRGLSAPGKLSAVAGLPLPQVLAELTRLERSGSARTVNGHWGRT